MTLTVFAPLRLEARAVRRGLAASDVRVVRTGMGPARARAAATRVTDRYKPVGPVAVAGVCGGVAAGLGAGHVVVASAVRTEDGVERALREPEILEAAVRELGLDCLVGPVLSVTRLQRDARRAARGHDVVAVDMESAWIVDAVSDLPLAVLRVVADSEGRSIYRPRTLVDGARALSGLRHAAPALERWAARVAEGVETRTIDPIAGRRQREVV